MKLILIVLGVCALIAALIALGFWGLVSLSTKEPLQSLPIAERGWEKARVTVRQMNYFKLGAPGHTEYFLVAAASREIARCPEAQSTAPSHRETTKAGLTRVELLPTLTGGDCGRRSFEGSTLPADPRRLELPLPDLEKAPVRLVFAEGGREAEIELRADKDKVSLVKLSDPAGLVEFRHPALKRLPDSLYLAVGAATNPLHLWGGNIHILPADGSPEISDSLGDLVQYCRGPVEYEYASGMIEKDGKEIPYMQGVSDEPLDKFYDEIVAELKAAGRPADGLVLRKLYLDGREEHRP